MLHARLRGRQVHGWLLAALLGAAVGSLAPATAGAARADDLATADRLARSGQHAEAAVLYESLGRRMFRGWDTRTVLLAAREYRAAGKLDDAERMLAKVSGPVRGDDAVLLARVEAEVALARGRPGAALDALSRVPEPWPAALGAELLVLLTAGSIYFPFLFIGIAFCALSFILIITLPTLSPVLLPAVILFGSVIVQAGVALAFPSPLFGLWKGDRYREKLEWDAFANFLSDLALIASVFTGRPFDVGRMAHLWDGHGCRG